jgi:RES domain-containing protein
VVLWRVSNYATLDGSGGLFVSGRWHSKGRPVVYCSENPATALLETLVHIEIDSEDRPENFQLLKIVGSDSISLAIQDVAGLESDWINDTGTTQAVGNAWIASMRSALLRVPSALVPETWNMLINPAHPDAKLLRIETVYQHPFDARLFE